MREKQQQKEEAVLNVLTSLRLKPSTCVTAYNTFLRSQSDTYTKAYEPYMSEGFAFFK